MGNLNNLPTPIKMLMLYDWWVVRKARSKQARRNMIVVTIIWLVFTWVTMLATIVNLLASQSTLQTKLIGSLFELPALVTYAVLTVMQVKGLHKEFVDSQG